MNQFEMIVIGAGLSGIAFARFYLDVHPESKLVILEKDSCVGGVWNSARVFDGFWSQSGQRISGFSDSPFKVPPEASTYYDMYEARYATEYLENYVDDHAYHGQSLRQRIRFGLDVQAIDQGHGIWTITMKDSHGIPSTLLGRNLAVASGLTSVPKMPDLPGQGNFTNPVCHHRDFGKISPGILESSNYADIMVLGGGKSAADMAYVSVKGGKKVTWVIPWAGKGPAEFMDPRADAPYKNAVEAGMTRNATALNPSCFAVMPLWSRLLHRTPLGRLIVGRRAQATDQRYRALANYRGRQGALPSFRDLEPQMSFWWSNGPPGMVQHDDFWETIANNVVVKRSDIEHMRTSTIVLKDGSEIATDILFCGTGWESKYPFISQDQASRLGLPCDPSMQAAKERNMWDRMTEKADRQILTEFPMLSAPPQPGFLKGNLTPARLYNGIASLDDNSIVFLGRVHSSNSFRTAEAQAIWATAYLDGVAPLPKPEIARWQVAHMNAFSKWRYPSFGSDGLYFFNDLVGYTDKILRDVGLKSHRKDWWTNWDAPCLASDLRDVKDEYLLIRQ